MIEIAHGVLYSVLAFLLLTGAGNWACRWMFVLTGLKVATDAKDGEDTASAQSSAQAAGWIIGWLERVLLAIGILSHSWEIIAAVIALKTVARFKELDRREFAEYFLVGSLFSVIWAFAVTTAWLAYDRHLGLDIRAQIALVVEAPGPRGGD
jgi:hypothetical protein